jgi:hypothetical protein
VKKKGKGWQLQLGRLPDPQHCGKRNMGTQVFFLVEEAKTEEKNTKPTCTARILEHVEGDGCRWKVVKL